MRKISTPIRASPPNIFAGTAFCASLIRVRPRPIILNALLVALVAGCSHVNPRAASRAANPMDQVISLASFDDALLGRAIFEETNRVRAAQGVPQLAPNPALDAAAYEQASWTALVLDARHGNPIPGEHTAAQRVARAGLVGSRVGENAIMMPAQRPAGSQRPDYTYSELAAFLVDKWMNSPGHRANIVDPGFTLSGCATRIARGVVPPDQRVFAIQVFFVPFTGAAAGK
jgi:uncharacterized protein YkwD